MNISRLFMVHPRWRVVLLVALLGIWCDANAQTCVTNTSPNFPNLPLKIIANSTLSTCTGNCTAAPWCVSIGLSVQQGCALYDVGSSRDGLPLTSQSGASYCEKTGFVSPCAAASFYSIPASACAAQSVCVAGAFVSRNATVAVDRACTQCANMTFSNSNNQYACNAALQACAAGYASVVAPTPTSDRVCTPSPAALGFVLDTSGVQPSDVNTTVLLAATRTSLAVLCAVAPSSIDIFSFVVFPTPPSAVVNVTLPSALLAQRIAALIQANTFSVIVGDVVVRADATTLSAVLPATTTVAPAAQSSTTNTTPFMAAIAFLVVLLVLLIAAVIYLLVRRRPAPRRKSRQEGARIGGDKLGEWWDPGSLRAFQEGRQRANPIFLPGHQGGLTVNMSMCVCVWVWNYFVSVVYCKCMQR